jgi:hypothetical protein
MTEAMMPGSVAGLHKSGIGLRRSKLETKVKGPKGGLFGIGR